MTSRRQRPPKAIGVLAFAIGVCCLAPVADADSGLVSELVCQPVPAPGRVLCDLELRSSGSRLVWGDALVVNAPEFARPLRARVAGGRVSEAGNSRKISLAFVAARTGRAPVDVLARAVICGETGSDGEQECRPELRRLRAELAVGSGL